MDQRMILAGLEDLAERMGLKVRYERLGDDEVNVRSGRCRLRGEEIILMDRRLRPAGRIEILRRELGSMDLADIFIKPYLRAILEETAEHE
jgi:hypothetical protein